MSELAVGASAPDFELLDDSGDLLRLSRLRGKWVVLTFYAEDGTPVCTTQACSFRDVFDGFHSAKATLLAISPDSVETHAAWKKKEKLPFTLLSDPGNKVATRYGAHGAKLMYGKPVIGVIRTTIVINPKGIISSIQRRFRTPGHGARALDALRAAQRESF